MEPLRVPAVLAADTEASLWETVEDGVVDGMIEDVDVVALVDAKIEDEASENALELDAAMTPG